MKFSSALARRYILSQKRHSCLTILSIAAAAALITVIFILASTYWVSMGNISVYESDYHATIYDLTEEQAKLLEEKDYIDKADFSKGDRTDEYGNVTTGTVTNVIFNKKVDDCELSLLSCFKEMGYAEDSVEYTLNNRALIYQIIGFDAKYTLLQIFSVLYVFVLFIIFCARFIIDTAFEISSKEREKQFGILRSVGASKKQITRILLCEGGYLSMVGVPLGLLLGTGLAFVIYKAVLSNGIAETLTADPKAGAKLINFYVYPPLLAIAAVTGIVWTLLSAYGTGVRCAKADPIDTIRMHRGIVRKIKKRSLSAKIFGISGKLAARNIRRSKKRYVITIVSMSLSITLFVMVEYAVRCFENVTVAGSGTIAAQNDADMLLEITEPVNLNELSEYVKPENIDVKGLKNKIEESGYFSDVRPTLSSYMLTENDDNIEIYFTDREHYDKMFNGSPDVTYDELNKQNGFIYLNCSAADLDPNYEGKKYKTNLSDKKEPFELKGEVFDRSYLEKPIEIEDQFGEKKLTVQPMEKVGITINVIKVYNDFYESFLQAVPTGSPMCTLIGTEEQYYDYFEKYSEGDYVIIYLDIADESEYYEAKKFITSLSEHSFLFDQFGERLKEKKTAAAIKTGGYFFAGMVALIAVINLVNIISTGIINRRDEIDSLRSVGMSNRQVTKMLVIESLCYSVISGFTSLLMCAVIMTVTFKFNMYIGFDNNVNKLIKLGLINDLKNISGIFLIMAIAFVIGIITSRITSRYINKTLP